MMRCPRCFRADDTQDALQGRCVDKQTIGCPAALEVVPGKDVILKCRADACDKQFAVPAVSLLRVSDGRRSIPPEVSCMRTPCEIVVLTALLTAPIETQADAPKEEKRSKPAKRS